MRTYFFSVLFVLSAIASKGQTTLSTISVTRLRCEYMVNPSGIDATRPRLSWELVSSEKNKEQSAYQVEIAGDSLSLLRGQGNLWNGKKTISRQTNQVPYKGSPLRTGQECYWRVRIWDERGNLSAWSPAAHWSMGLLHPDDWKARWIGGPTENIPPDSQYYAGSGYHSGWAGSPKNTKWVVIDLGRRMLLDELQLFPVIQGDSSYLFPEKFRIFASDKRDFSTRIEVIAETGKDHPKNDTSVYRRSIGPLAARYVKLEVTRLAETSASRYAFALAECRILYNHKDIALHAAITVSDHLIYGDWQDKNWKPEYLVDGFTKSNTRHPNFSISVPPSPLLRKTFALAAGIKKATLYATALGFYTISLNGVKAGDHVLAPEWTDYHTRVQYQAYDVTPLLKPGTNIIGAVLADGWWAGAVFSHPDRGSYGFDRRLLAQLEVEMEDGSIHTICTDRTWKIWIDGPVRQASIYNGEVFDANRSPQGWDRSGYDDAAWGEVTVGDPPHILLSAQQNEPIKVIAQMTPAHWYKSPKDTYIFDMGQNIAGWCRLSIPYNPGRPLKLRYAEILQDDGGLYTDNLRSAEQTDTYIPGRESAIAYSPQFTYHGFRYVEVTGLSQTPDSNTLKACVVASSAVRSGYMNTSDTLLNKLWSNIMWTQIDNMPSVPTDCPQRDERAGWMGDAQVFSQSAIYNMDMAAFFTKWIRDIYDSQLDDGRFPDFSPQVGDWMAFYNSPGWSDAAIILPWRLYENYGDTAILAVCYRGMKKYIDFLKNQNKDLIWRNATGNMYGDWLNGNTIIGKDYPKDKGQVPNDVYSTAFFAYSTRILARTAALLGKTNEAIYYKNLSTAIRDAFIKTFVNENGEIKGQTQAGYAMALEFDLLPESLKSQAAKHMADAVAEYDYRISTGIQSTVRLMNQLTKYGYTDIAYRLLQSRRFPSWLYSIDQGATTIWERWDGYVKGRGFQDKGMNSFNHYAIGAVVEWMYQNMLGIGNDPETPGFRHIIISPISGGSVQWATGQYQAITGNINVSWKKDADSFTLDVDIPVNTRATIILPPGKSISENDTPIDPIKDTHISTEDKGAIRVTTGSGTYHFKVIR